MNLPLYIISIMYILVFIHSDFQFPINKFNDLFHVYYRNYLCTNVHFIKQKIKRLILISLEFGGLLLLETF